MAVIIGTLNGEMLTGIFGEENTFGTGSPRDPITFNPITEDNDVFTGADRDDFFGLSLGSDVIKGGAGFDHFFADVGFGWFYRTAPTVGSRYALRADGVTIDLEAGTYSVHWSGTVTPNTDVTQFPTTATSSGTLESIEAVSGSRGDDTISGSNETPVLSNGRVYWELFISSFGNDTIDGRGGTDTYWMQAFDGITHTAVIDTQKGTAISYNGFIDTISNFEQYFFSDFTSEFLGSNADEVVQAYAAGGRLIGAGGFDQLFFVSSDSVDGGVRLDLSNGRAFKMNGGGPKTIVAGFEEYYGTNYGDRMAGGDEDDYLDGRNGDDTLFGGGGEDELLGWGGHDTISGGAGNDTLFGGSGDDTLKGGAGSDRLIGWFGGDTMFGGDGFDSVNYNRETGDIGVVVNLETLSGTDTWGGIDTYNTDIEAYVGSILKDTLIGADQNDELWGYQGDDTIIGGGGNDYLVGGEGNDEIDGGSGKDDVIGDSSEDGAVDGNDILRGGADDDTVTGMGGDDDLFGDGGSDIVFGGAGEDSLEGNNGDDSLYGGADRDELYGGAGQDHLEGGDEAGLFFGDRLYGGADDDFLDGGDGRDRLFGGKGSDELIGRDGNDLMEGGAGDDTFKAGKGDDTFDGGKGMDTLILRGSKGTITIELKGIGQFTGGGFGDNRVKGIEQIIGTNKQEIIEGRSANEVFVGKGGSDTLIGAGGKDSLFGGNGADSLDGGAGSDFIEGGGKRDVIRGGGSSDTIDAGAGNDVISGGSGADVFIWSKGHDVIKDFNLATDRIDITGGLDNFTGRVDASSSATIESDKIVIISSSGNTLTLEGVSVSVPGLLQGIFLDGA